MLIAIAALFVGSISRAGAQEKRLELHEWSVWGTSPNLDTVNDESRYSTAMPVLVESSRTSAADRLKSTDGLTPVTIMTFHGEPQTGVDVGLRSQSGRLVGHWPRGTTSDRRLRWNRVDLFQKQPADARYAVVTEGHWFNQARRLESLYLRVGTRDERFIAYDPVVKWSLPIELSGGPETFTLVNTGAEPLYDIALSVPSEQGRRIAWLNELPAAVQPKADEKPAGPSLTARQSIDAHPGGVACLAVSPNGQTVATAGSDNVIKVWQLSDGKQLLTLEGHSGPVTGLVYLPDGEKLASVSRDKTVRLWSTTQGTQISSEELSDEGLALAISSDGKRLIAGSKNGRGMILDPVEGKVIAKSYTVHRDNFQAVAVTPNGRTVVTGGGDRIAKLWNIIGTSYTAGAGKLAGHGGPLTAIVMTPDSKTAITGSTDSTVRVWDLEARKESQSLKQTGPVSGLALSTNGETLAIALADTPEVILYDIKNNKESTRLAGHQGGVRAVTASSDGTWLTAGTDGSLKQWGDPAQATNKPKGPPVEVTLSAPLPAGSDTLQAQTTEALKTRIVTAGLAADEAELLLSMYAKPIFESKKLVVVFRIPQGQLDDKLPLDIFPEPTKIVRVALIVATDIDPRVAGEITTLVAQLGDPDYAKRESAERRLGELGPLALPALREALKQSDVEIVFRAERLLIAQNQQVEPK